MSHGWHSNAGKEFSFAQSDEAILGYLGVSVRPSSLEEIEDERQQAFAKLSSDISLRKKSGGSMPGRYVTWPPCSCSEVGGHVRPQTRDVKNVLYLSSSRTWSTGERIERCSLYLDCTSDMI